jgi:hypothetical protein
MPLYLFQDEYGHEREQFMTSADDKGCLTQFCKICQSTMAPVIAYGQGLCYFEEGRGRLIWNLGPEPILVKSAEQHKRLMRLNKVDFANRGVGYPGQWI